MHRWDTEAEAPLTSGEEGTQFSMICGNSSSDGGMWTTGGTYGYTENRCRASLLCESSHELADWSCGWRTCHKCCMRKASLACVRPHEFGALRLDRSLPDKWDRQMAPHSCVFSGALTSYRNIWRLWGIYHICMVWDLCGVSPGHPHRENLPPDSGKEEQAQR